MASTALVLRISDKIYVPYDAIPSPTRAKENYTHSFWDEQSCRKCEYKPDRPSAFCGECEAYRGTVKFYTKKTIQGVTHLGFPIGDKRNFEHKVGVLFSECKIKDLRTSAPFKYPIKFTLDLYDYQEVAVEAYLKKKYGLLEAPPRTGKTAMSLYIAIALGHRILMLANQHEFVGQFLDHIHGNEKEGIPKCTNLPELEKKHKKKLYGIPKTDADFENFQIFCMTYQQFISESSGADRLRRIFPHVGTLVVDEVHKVGADKYASVISRFPSRYKVGVTATVDRKDGRQVLVKNIIGPIVAKSVRESLIPTVYVYETGFVPRARYSGKRAWTFAMQALSRSKPRNRLIVEKVIADLKKGHNIVIPVYFKNHVLLLRDMINKAYGKDICGVFMGGGGKRNKADRKRTLADAKAGKIRVTIGIRSLLQLGLNVPAWSCIHEVMPISNEPNLKQETSRVRTPMEGKIGPVIRLYVDENLGQSLGCARNSIKHMMGFKYKFSKLDSQKSLVSHVLSSGRSGSRTAEDLDDAKFKVSRSSMGTRQKVLPKGLFTQSKRRL